MTVVQLVQLYAPLAGLLILSFWVGRLSQRVTDLEEDVNELKKGGFSGEIIALKEQVRSMGLTLDRLYSAVAGNQRLP